MKRVPTQVKNEMEYWINRMLEEGFAPIDSIVHIVMSVCDELPEAASYIPEARKYAERELSKALDEQRKLEATWPEVTDCDRLDTAFDELQSRGILAEQHFDLDISGGSHALMTELRTRRAAGEAARGWTFYSMQDTDYAMDEGLLFLAYGAASPRTMAMQIIAREIIHVVESHGLRTQWGGDVGERIAIPIDWKRRVVGGDLPRTAGSL